MDITTYEAIKEKALKQVRTRSLLGKDGALTPLVKEILEAALEAELQDHLAEQKSANKRNGRSQKTMKSIDGSFVLETPRDRDASFQPKIVPKRETILADSLQEKIIGLYGLGMSYDAISGHIEEMYDTKISSHTLQQITDRVIPRVQAWQNRILDSVYSILWLDAMHFKVRENSQVKSKALYNILGINTGGKKEILGVYLAENESSRFWLQVLTDLKNRGLKDVLIVCTDNLNGFSEAIQSIYPKTEIQSCMIHQIRNSCKYVASKNKKAFMQDLKAVYQAPNKETAQANFDLLAKNWEFKYPIVVRSWRNNWEKLTTYFSYTEEVRRMIYTTNAIEGYHRQIRKVTKTKGAFSSDMGLLKLVYLATQRIERKWTMPLHNWGLVAQQLSIRFGDRMPLSLA